ncbi:MAG: membrane protein insertion efficiency factor YidD [Lachnospiraceae bacterium]|jgi:putative membrane protein insertion efficiency factor|nr:membrane protein insertion efficiency factor YidD [Lachnospiraceae bacterium]
MKKIIIRLINFYQKKISLNISQGTPKCRFYPTCSEYTKQAVEKYGVGKGLFLGLKRIIKCNPFFKGGYDPLK